MIVLIKFLFIKFFMQVTKVVLPFKKIVNVINTFRINKGGENWYIGTNGFH